MPGLVYNHEFQTQVSQKESVVLQQAAEILRRVSSSPLSFAGASATPSPNDNGLDSNASSPHTPGGVIRRERTLAKRVRGPYDVRQRTETAETRKVGACLRCNKQKIRCIKDSSGDCKGCLEGTERRIYDIPCIRDRINQARLFIKEAHPHYKYTKRWDSMNVVDIQDWASDALRTIAVTQDVRGLSYNLVVRQFVPKDGDAVVRTWLGQDGQHKTYYTTPWAIANMEDAGRDLYQFVGENVEPFINHYIRKDDLLSTTYKMALHRSRSASTPEERELLRLVLELWTAIRMETRSERICGMEKLDMLPQSVDAGAASCDHVLIPPVMGAQIELIMTCMVLEPIKRQILKTMNKMHNSNKAENWLTIYLCLFILLHSCAMYVRNEKKQAQKHGLRTDYWHDSLVKELEHGTKILLAHFHHKIKGGLPLEVDYRESNASNPGMLTDDEKEFINSTKAMLSERRHHVEGYLNRQEGPLLEEQVLDYQYLSKLFPS